MSLQLRFEDNLGSLCAAYERGLQRHLSSALAGMRQQLGECVSAAFVLLVNVIKHLARPPRAAESPHCGLEMEHFASAVVPASVFPERTGNHSFILTSVPKYEPNI